MEDFFAGDFEITGGLGIRNSSYFVFNLQMIIHNTSSKVRGHKFVFCGPPAYRLRNNDSVSFRVLNLAPKSHSDTCATITLRGGLQL